MTRFSPTDAALEGLRVMRREPWAVAYWIAVWSLAFAGIASIRLLTGSLSHAGAPHDDLGVIRRYGPLAVVLIPTVLVLWVMTTATVYRAVLRPGEHGWHLFKLGSDEARIAILSFAETIIATVLGGMPAYLLLVLLNPIFELAPGLSHLTAVGGFLATILIDMWLAVRLSLAPVQTFAEHRFPLSAYWGFARGHYWRLLGGYVVVAGEILIFLVLSVLVGGVFGWLADLVVVHWHDGGWLRSGVLWLLVAILAALTAVAWVVPAILICGFQAFAYRAIAASAPSPAPAEPEPAPA